MISDNHFSPGIRSLGGYVPAIKENATNPGEVYAPVGYADHRTVPDAAEAVKADVALTQSKE